MRAEQTQEQALKQVRDQIDEIDRDIQRLLNERARCAQRVAEIKSQFESQDAVFYRPEREAQVLRRVMERNQGPLPDSEVARLFREIMSVCLALEQPLDVVFLGPEATFTQQARRNISATRYAVRRWTAWKRCSATWRAAMPTTAWCRSKMWRMA